MIELGLHYKRDTLRPVHKFTYVMSTLIQPASIQSVRRQFLKAQASFDSHAAVFQAISERLLERLELLAVKPERVLDLGCRSGYQLQALAGHYPRATIFGADPAPGQPAKLPRSWPGWLRKPALAGRPAVDQRIACDPHHLPFASGSFDLVISNLLMPWCEAPHRVFAEVSRVLGEGGAYMFTSAGPDTLIEYRKAWASVDSHLHSFGLLDMHDLGDAMMKSGFAAPVLDRENITVDYPDIESLQAELRNLGAANIAGGRRPGLMAEGAAKQLAQASPGRSEQARFPVTLELVQGHGWKGELKSGTNDAGEISIPVESLRGSWNNRSR